MNSRLSNTAVIAAFTLHNAEEIAFLNRAELPAELVERFGLIAKVYRQDRMALATGILTAFVTVMTDARLARSGRAGRFVATAATGALAGNAVNHIMRAVLQRSYNPGVVTAPVLLWAAGRQLLRRVPHQGRRDVAVATAVGNVASVPAIVLSLWAAYSLTRQSGR
ncbi:hypothetical protein GCM10022198_09200 [Klugiella xanthotipulae]|uniref:Uncharacterized protein with HXXEE motif n=1 Tax=Klugiella xanthotipulae TaxID=244735 RepID=A0A543I648_9MICO|nr:HXXEE domain-containing protein [Klugiella xanthotipulae]TQM66049.1 uncharacterized protein with HXXEE motif [Klugiella xanthotipulae]